MRNILTLVFCSLLMFAISCREVPRDKAETKPDLSVKVDSPMAHNPNIGKPVVEVEKIVKNFPDYWTYYNLYAQLHKDFQPFDEQGKPMEKLAFLRAIESGDYLPWAFYSGKAEYDLRLAKMPANTVNDIKWQLMNEAERAIPHYKMEGKPFPSFDLTDLNDIHYTNANTKGKIVLFKCWFISCVNCVKEMPALNELVAKLKDRKDIVFISLAIDPKKELQEFLLKTNFDYATVAMQEKFMEKTLHVSAYPTHFIINKNGNMVKAVTEEGEMERYLTKLL